MIWDWNLALSSGLSRGSITLMDEALIREYVNLKAARDHISPSRVNGITSRLISFRKYLPLDYSAFRLKDLYSGVSAFLADENYTKNSKQSYLAAIKPFILWLIESKKNILGEKGSFAKVKAIKLPPPDRHVMRPEDLLTPEEIVALSDACTNPRDRAIIWTLYESGVRISELGRLTWGDLSFTDVGVTASIVDTKEDRRRIVYLVKARDYLIAWRNELGNPKGPVFVNLYGGKVKPLSIKSIARILFVLGERAGIKKNIHPHIFRHSRITHLVRAGAQESIIKTMMWGNTSTQMFETYVSLAGTDVENEMMRISGLKKAKARPDPTAPRVCVRCGQVNGPTINFCGKCGNPLTVEGISEEEKLFQRLLDVAKRDPGKLIEALKKVS